MERGAVDIKSQTPETYPRYEDENVCETEHGVENIDHSSLGD